MGLKLALHKSEALVITKYRHHNQLVQSLKVLKSKIDSTSNTSTYDSIKKLAFTEHARITAKKASKAVQNLSRILPNVSAAKQAKRTLLANVVHSIQLYGAPIWVDKMSKAAGMAELNKVQRRIALRVASAYRTTSTDAVLVITGFPPIDLQTTEREKMYEEKGNNTIDK